MTSELLYCPHCGTGGMHKTVTKNKKEYIQCISCGKVWNNENIVLEKKT